MMPAPNKLPNGIDLIPANDLILPSRPFYERLYAYEKSLSPQQRVALEERKLQAESTFTDSIKKRLGPFGPVDDTKALWVESTSLFDTRGAYALREGDAKKLPNNRMPIPTDFDFQQPIWERSGPLSEGYVYVFGKAASGEAGRKTWAHEFRHRAFDELRVQGKDANTIMSRNLGPFEHFLTYYTPIARTEKMLRTDEEFLNRMMDAWFSDNKEAWKVSVESFHNYINWQMQDLVDSKISKERLEEHSLTKLYNRMVDSSPDELLSELLYFYQDDIQGFLSDMQDASNWDDKPMSVSLFGTETWPEPWKEFAMTDEDRQKASDDRLNRAAENVQKIKDSQAADALRDELSKAGMTPE